MKRSKHSLSHYVLSTFDMGNLVPVSNFEVLPGDSIRMSTSCLLRVSPLMTPVMHPVTVRLHHWFCPYRILWDGWEDFITGGPLGTNNTPPPQVLASDLVDGGGMRSLGDYLGIGAPLGQPYGINIFPFRAYNKIFNEFYRDQDLQAELNQDNTLTRNCCWEKDYFTSARPWTQKGPEVTLPLAGTAPIRGLGILDVPDPADTTTLDTDFRETPDVVRNWPFGAGGVGWAASIGMEVTQAEGAGMFPNVYADLSGATATAINDVRRAFALQRYQEARAQYGSRYTEYLRYLGVRSSDSRLQRPEYLGGGRSTIAFSEVLKTGEGDAPSDDAPIGELRGHGISAQRTRGWTRFFEEHGVVLTLASVRPRTMYVNGIYRGHSRQTKEDYWQKELEQIGQQEVLNKEVYSEHVTPEGIFGYQDRYAEYRHLPSYVCGDFRNTLNDWHLGRIFGSDPALNADFVNCVPTKRVHAVQSEDVLWGMFSHSIQARRLVGHKTIGRVF